MALGEDPRRLAHALVARRSYKNSAADDRRAAREAIVAGLEAGRTGRVLKCDDALRATLLADASGDRLDAVLCLMQAAAASRRPGYGIPADVDPVEGWIAAD